MKKYIVSDPDILGGTPVIKGTRIPVDRILFLFKEGYTIDDIHNEYDHVDVKTLEKVLDELSTIAKGTKHEPLEGTNAWWEWSDKKADKQFNFLVRDMNYPSLGTKKKQGEDDI